MRLTFFLLFLSQLAVAQVVVDVQKERCEVGKESISVVAIYHTKKLNDQLLLVEHFRDTSFELRSLADYRSIWMPFRKGTYSFKIDEREVPVIFTKLDSLNHFTLDSGCTYSVHVLDQADSPYYWYVGNKFILPIYFDLGKSTLQPERTLILDDLVKTLNKYPHISIEVGVHADERISRQLSTCMTCSRAEAIVSYLVAKGISNDRLTAKGYQGDKPFLVGAKTEAEHQQNRQTVITVTAIRP